MDKQYFIMAHDEARARAMYAVKNAPQGYVVEVKEPTRSLAQNALLWSLLQQVSQKMIWYGEKLSAECWKDMFTASLKKQKVVPGIDGSGFVVCGQPTSTMSKAELSELTELILAFCAEKCIPLKEYAEAA